MIHRANQDKDNINSKVNKASKAMGVLHLLSSISKADHLSNRADMAVDSKPATEAELPQLGLKVRPLETSEPIRS